MELNGINIQIAQAGISALPAGNADANVALKSKQAALADSTGSGGRIVEQHIYSLLNANYVKKQIDTILTSFPPYFPAGSPQRLDLIKGVTVVQDEIKSSKLPNDVKEKLAGQKLTDTSTDKEISTALSGVKQYTKDNAPSTSQSSEAGQPVRIVSIQV